MFAMWYLFLLFIPILFHAQETVSPQQIARELDEDQNRFDRAKKMFNPWYTGPLVTPSPGMAPPGMFVVQPYLFFGATYAQFDSKRNSKSLPHNEYTLELSPLFQTGLTDSVDLSLTPGGIVNWQNGQTGGGFQDLQAVLGFLVVREGLYVPGMKFSVAETFPTGKYKNLSFNGLGLNSTGGGSYQTQFGLSIGKTLWGLYEHPVNLLGFIGYTISTVAHVKGFNTYGGDKTTKGTVHPGNALTTDIGIQCSLTQKWVFALDTVYVAQGRTKFNGSTNDSVGGGYNDNLSFAPALEYNFNPNFGLIWGVQFSVYGRNSANFAQGQFSVLYVW